MFSCLLKPKISKREQIQYYLEYNSFIIDICEYIDYSSNISYKDKLKHIENYDFSEFNELELFLCDAKMESYGENKNKSKNIVKNFYRKIYNKHILLNNLITSCEKRNVNF